MQTREQLRIQRDRLLEEMDKEARKSLTGPHFEIATAGQVSDGEINVDNDAHV